MMNLGIGGHEYNLDVNLQFKTMDNQQQGTSSYSTIFHCTQDGFVCFLRFLEGVISVFMFVLFVRGYKIITNEKNNPISKEQRNIFIFAMSQTLILASYYLLFEEFFVLATIRNLLIWIAIHVLSLLWKIYSIEDADKIKTFKKVQYLLIAVNFLLWFVIGVGDGSALVNTNFNLGYNCRLMDWVVLSGFFLIITAAQAVLAYAIVDRLIWEENQKQDKNKEALIKEQKENIIMIVGGSVLSALIMFFWDYLNYMLAENDEMCVELFSGNTFFRKILCFLLKVISMQAVPSITYYTFYFRRKSQFVTTQTENLIEGEPVDVLNDDAASQLNRSLTSRIDSRGSLFSVGSRQNL